MDSLKSSRRASFAAVTLIYILATAVGIFAYSALPFSFWVNLLIADVLATIVTFAFSLLLGNASVYDPYWSVQPPVIVTAFVISEGVTTLGVLLLIVIWLWGARLTANWAYTFHGLNHQDWRYTMLSEKCGKFYPIVNFVGIHTVPTLVVYGCVLPAVFAVKYEAVFNPLCAVFLIISVLATAMQGVADCQMHSYKKNRTSPFIRVGLWRYSRHPNYLGEIMMWWGVALAAVAAMPDRWYLCLGAVANTLLFTFVSIPMADKRQARKAGFEQYKAETRVLLPIKK